MPTQPWGGPPPMAVPPAGAGAVTVGSLVSRTFRTWWAHVGRYAVVLLIGYGAIALAGLVAALVFGVQLLTAFRPGAEGAPPQLQLLPGFVPAILVVSLVALVFGSALFGAMTFGALQHLAGRPVTIGSMLGAGLRRAWPLLLVVLAEYVLVALGLVALIVPGIIIALALTAAIPIVVAERATGAGAAIKRSFSLTKGNRGSLLGAVVVLFLAMQAVGTVGNLLMTAVRSSQALTIVAGLLAVSMQAAIGPLIFVFSAVAYHDLRLAKEGIDTSKLAEVFE